MKVIGVFDRGDTFAGEMGGPVFLETCAAFCHTGIRPLIANNIYGLGGRDLSLPLLQKACLELAGAAAGGAMSEHIQYLGLRGEEE